MILKIGLYFLVLIIGIIIGQKDIFGKKIYKKLDIAQTLSVLALIFIMGIKIGLDKEVMSSLPIIGVSAVIMAAFSIVGSILCVWIGRKLIIEKLQKLFKIGKEVKDYE